ncbi:ABC transporter permease [Aneurinibacillus aneurinilyticus]|jgi:osmoprotectant transport system permease protein|uniref:ABC transporter permease n=2 Tax=Aneurinibacillus aneurinilyticus TaxID=1391 RepID=A0A848CYL2_ANEAE|nr:ABC transporter permease [Aneurinibacillus aneurinilyticus]ERI09094.1 putative choline transport system permease protein opuBB [Aneurinibacillus aneurinilyticus ATCC 12856]MCI1693327.1 ABC transporter permease [Aneurinibacillus aneurinilyticus]MED0671402.1 ABC transporter permease [Aneurinibacillus aneurinilyticus]MED0707504.1 ABC transporter permease [Aneurinibacillus aneurinilyticus]MED0723872.1 ABC transporter permease [Aneurinibacillus aneurinilyticus]
MEKYAQVFVERWHDLYSALIEHIILSASAVLLGCLVAIPLGTFLAKTSIGWIRSLSFTIANIFQTIPSLALLAILIPLLGIGTTPAILALFLYSLMPILQNTYSGFQSIDPGIIEAAKAVGYSSSQRLFKIELPLAIRYIMSGVRLTTVYIISWATLATVIGAGGLGELIVGGLSVYDKPLIFASAVLAMVLALVVDFVLSLFEKKLTKRENSKQNFA